MNRRQFTKRAALTLTVAGIAGAAPKCSGGDKVSLGVRTIAAFLNQIAGLLPAHASAIAKVIKIATDFDAAFERGDFDSADNLFNSLERNLVQLTNDIGVNVSNDVKTWIAIVGAALTSIAVFFKKQKPSLPTPISAKADTAKSAPAVERLASQAAVDALYETAKPKP